MKLEFDSIRDYMMHIIERVTRGDSPSDPLIIGYKGVYASFPLFTNNQKPRKCESRADGILGMNYRAALHYLNFGEEGFYWEERKTVERLTPNYSNKANGFYVYLPKIVNNID